MILLQNLKSRVVEIPLFIILVFFMGNVVTVSLETYEDFWFFAIFPLYFSNFESLAI